MPQFHKTILQYLCMIAIVGLSLLLLKFYALLLFALFLYYISRPLYKFFNKRIINLPILWAIVSQFLIILPILFFFSYAIYIGIVESVPLIKKISTYAKYAAPHTEKLLHAKLTPDGKTAVELFEEIKKRKSSNIGSTFKTVQNLFLNFNKYLNIKFLFSKMKIISGYFTGILISLSTLSFNFIFAVFMAIVLLIYDTKISAYFKNHIFKNNDTIERFFFTVDKNLSEIYMGNVLIVVITAFLASLFLLIFDLLPRVSIPYPVFIGILCGLASLIPTIGMKLAYFPLTIFIFIDVWSKHTLSSGIFYGIAFLIVFAIIVDTLPDIVLRPFIASKDLSALLLFLSYLFGSMLFGGIGILLGPLILVLIVNYFEIIYPEVIV